VWILSGNIFSYIGQQGTFFGLQVEKVLFFSQELVFLKNPANNLRRLANKKEFFFFPTLGQQLGISYYFTTSSG
jgi:hypothetical protein